MSMSPLRRLSPSVPTVPAVPRLGRRTGALLLTLTALAALSACSSAPLQNAQLDQARGALRNAQADGQTATLAPAELALAGSALARAETAVNQSASSAEVDQLAYLATQRVALAQAVGARKAAEAEVTRNTAAQDRFRLAARTQEADAAQSRAVTSQQQAANAQQLAANAQQQTGVARERNRQLEAQLTALNAKQTQRGMVITIGDVLFDNDRAELKSGARRGMDQLAGFMKEYPQRRALIEGYTDSRGSDAHNQALSSRRAESVRNALEEMGISGTRLEVQGRGEAFPVAGNDNSGGRQANRRVEILLSDEAGTIANR